MQITGVVAPVRCVSRRFRSFQVINRSRVQVDYLYYLLLGLGSRRFVYRREGNRTVRTDGWLFREDRSVIAEGGTSDLPPVRGPGASHNHLRSPLLAAGAISPAATNHHEEADDGRSLGGWKPRPSPRRGKVANSFAPLSLSLSPLHFSLFLSFSLCIFRFFCSRSSASPS